MATFMVVGKNEPLYELSLEASVAKREDIMRASQFILHGSLDLVDLQIWTNPATCVLNVENPVSLTLKSALPHTLQPSQAGRST